MPHNRTPQAGLLLWFRKTAEILRDRTVKTGQDVEHLLHLHQVLETGEGGKAVLIERLFEELQQIRIEQAQANEKLATLLAKQDAMLKALNLPVEPLDR